MTENELPKPTYHIINSDVMSCPSDIQKVLDVAKAQEIAAYINRRNKRFPADLATLNRVCQRFKLKQVAVKRIIENANFLTLSCFAYVDWAENEASWAKKMIAMWHPQIVKPGDGSDGKRLVVVIDEVETG